MSMPPNIFDVSNSAKMASINRSKKGLSQSIHNPQADEEVQLRPRHFIVREGSAIVPLIPVDLLPTHLEIHGVPRQMNIEETTGMSNLGTFPKPKSQLQLYTVSFANDVSGRSVDNLCRDGLHTLNGDEPLEHLDRPHDPAPDPVIQAPVARWITDCGTEDLQSAVSRPAPTKEKPQPTATRVLDWAEDTESVSTDNFTATDEDPPTSSTFNTQSNPRQVPQAQRPSVTKKKEKSAAEIAGRMLELSRTQHAIRQGPPSQTNTQTNGDGTAKPPKPGKQKVPRPPGSLCRHWCQTGQCSWGIECRYTHQMPVTLEGLADIGLKELPGWWRRAAGLPVEGTIDIRIFAATAGNGKKSPSPALIAGDLSLIPTHPSKKTRSKVDKEERKMAEDVHMVRLGFERAQSTAAYPAVVGAGSSKKKPALGQVQLQMQTGKDQPQSGEIEKLVDI